MLHFTSKVITFRVNVTFCGVSVLTGLRPLGTILESFRQSLRPVLPKVTGDDIYIRKTTASHPEAVFNEDTLMMMMMMIMMMMTIIIIIIIIRKRKTGGGERENAKYPIPM